MANINKINIFLIYILKAGSHIFYLSSLRKLPEDFGGHCDHTEDMDIRRSDRCNKDFLWI